MATTTRGLSYSGKTLLSAKAVTATTRDHVTPAQRKDGEIILQEGYGWGLRDVGRRGENAERSARGNRWMEWRLRHQMAQRSGQALMTILLTQRNFDGPKPAALFNRFERDVRGIAG